LLPFGVVRFRKELFSICDGMGQRDRIFRNEDVLLVLG